MVAECHGIERTVARFHAAWFRVKEIREALVQGEKRV
jgi:hypothetical protein